MLDKIIGYIDPNLGNDRSNSAILKPLMNLLYIRKGLTIISTSS